jgi:hypothetical protein
VQNGQTVSGQSDPFVLGANQTLTVPHLTIGATIPVPTSLTISAQPAQLSSPGQTAQVAVIAKYEDNTQKDVTSSASGTTYQITNSAIATVSTEGVVTAVSSGTVYVQANNEGTQGIVAVQVVLGGKQNGGIPDDWALAHGLDPSDPTMPLQDPDHDGLTNLQEFQAGTDPHNPDTDGDHLSDGDEVNKYHTNPLVADTDGDGIPDGLEVELGTDPLNPNSFDYGRALSGITIKPPTFVLNINPIRPEPSIQLQVVGTFIEGFGTVDVTSQRRSTMYSSSDLTVCNFGGTDGQVFGGNSGSCTITANTSGHQATSKGLVDSFTPTAISFLNIPGFTNAIDVSGDLAYIASGPTGLQVVNVQDRSNPAIIGSVATPGNGDDVKVVGTYVYEADGSAGLQVIDVSNPATPVIAGALAVGGTARSLVVRGGRAYIAAADAGLQIADVTVPAHPVLLGSYQPKDQCPVKGVDVDLQRNLAVLACTTELIAMNVSDPTRPQLLGMSTQGLNDARNVVLKGNTAVVADIGTGMTTYDVTNPSSPMLLANVDLTLGGRLNDLKVGQDLVLGADVYFPNGVPMVDISNPAQPSPRFILDFYKAYGSGHDDDGHGIAIDNQYLYLVAVHGTAFVDKGDFNGTARLYIGQYQLPVDNFGIPPTATINSPKNGEMVILGSTVHVSVTATDDVGVAGVTLYVNGQTVQTINSAGPSFEFEYKVPTDAPSSLTLVAQATDFGANVGTSNTVVISTIPDPLTTAAGNVADKGNNPIPGANVLCNGVAGQSGADGAFSISGIPTVNGPIVCSATATIGNMKISGFSNPVLPVPGSTTNMGTIVLSAFSSRGQDFWMAYMSDIYSNGAQLFILSDTTANYTVSNDSISFKVTGTVTPQTPSVIAIPASLVVSGDKTVQSLGIHVTADADIGAFFYYPGPYSDDTYLAIPTQSLGTEYYTLSYVDDIGYPSELVVTATQDNTHVTISNLCGDPNSSVSPTMTRGQTYQVQCDDVSGTHIVSDNPVSVVAGVSCSDIPQGFIACDVIAEMMFPVGSLWAKDIYSAPLPGGGFDVYRVIAARDGTTVMVDLGNNNVQNFTLNQGQFKELQFKSGAHYTSNQPILVMQYMPGYTVSAVGDPFSMQIIPTNAFATSFRFYAPSNSGWTSQAIVIAPNSGTSSVQLNGKSVSGFSPLPGGTYQYATVNVPDGQNVVTSTQPMTVYSIGYYPYASYGTPTRF